MHIEHRENPRICPGATRGEKKSTRKRQRRPWHAQTNPTAVGWGWGPNPRCKRLRQGVKLASTKWGRRSFSRDNRILKKLHALWIRETVIGSVRGWRRRSRGASLCWADESQRVGAGSDLLLAVGSAPPLLALIASCNSQIAKCGDGGGKPHESSSTDPESIRVSPPSPPCNPLEPHESTYIYEWIKSDRILSFELIQVMQDKRFAFAIEIGLKNQQDPARNQHRFAFAFALAQCGGGKHYFFFLGINCS